MNNRNQNTRNRNSNNNAKIRYFNAHTEAFGYINGIREVSPQNGQDFAPFWVTTFCMLEGDPQNPVKKYINMTIVNLKLVDVLLEFEQELNSDVSVFANARIASLSAEPFVYGDNSKHVGQLGINWSGKMINLLYLKVGDQVIDLGLDDETTTDFGVPANQSQQFDSNRNNRSQGNQGQTSNQQGRQFAQRQPQGNGGNRPQGNFSQNQGGNNGYQAKQGGQNFGKSNRQHQSQGNYQQ